MINITDELFSLQDKKYRDFQIKLIPGIVPSTVIGIRTPVLRKFARDFFKSGEYNDFLHSLPHRYYDENNLHGFLVEQITDYDCCITELNRFLPYVDNWATCDLMRPKSFAKHKNELINQIRIWLGDTHTYTIRFALEMLMTFFLDADFKPEYLEYAASVKSSEYYVNMMVAWFFATALAKQYNDAVKYIEQNRLDLFTHNKAIQKARESFRITPEQKEYLNTLKRK